MELKKVFGPEGLIATQLPGYEYRIQQLEMAEAISQAFHDSAHLIIEAGTGVGKSFAYLLPAIDFAINMSERVVVSTNTISLQEQLINKDIPFLQKIFPHPFKVALAKGRGNYLCLRRLENVITFERGLFQTQDEDELVRIHQWSAETNDGSRSDLRPQPKANVWDQICSERDLCLGLSKCPYAKQCFYQKARNALYKANIIVVNHHLLFSDLVLRGDNSRFSVLPSYKYIVIDEAQNIENTATEHIGISLSNYGIRHLLDSLCHRDKKGGLFIRLGQEHLIELVEKARAKTDLFFQSIETWFSDESSETKRIRQKNFIPNVLDDEIYSLQSALQDLIPIAKTDEEEKEIDAFAERCMEIRSHLDIILNQSLDNSVYWAEISKGRFKIITLNSGPVNISDQLRPNLFDAMESIIMTSATLSTNGNFEYFKNRIGLNNCKEVILGSPFNYEKQVSLYIPPDMPDPREETFMPVAVEKIKKYIKLTQGKAFILFTSYGMLVKSYKELKGWLDENGINSFRQGGELSRYDMLEGFKTDVNSVLFGTSSFWEGVDVQGESLSNVIIVRLPFSVPTHPLVEARIEDIQSKGGDSFIEYNLPEAIIRLRQGFGRLIRNKTDTGIVVILDPRIKTKYYGRMFLNSLPKCKIIFE